MSRHRVVIVGTGFSGLGMGIALKKDGIEDFVLLEKAADLGGTWRDNTYPGCQCDVPSNLYSFSFAPNPDWTRAFPEQPEIWRYLKRCAERFGILPHIRFNHRLLSAAWDEEALVWRIETSQGPVEAEVLVSGMGALSDPSFPDLPGLESFKGTSFHTAAWNHDHALAGERVAVVGTGASAVQLIPRIQPKVGRLIVFQRTPPWVLPHRDRRVSERHRGFYQAVPAAQRVVRGAVRGAREAFVLPFQHLGVSRFLERVGRAHLERQVADPDLRARLTPDYAMGCKRILISNHYYPALQQPNVELVSEAVAEVRPHSLVTKSGAEHEVDTIVFATGFHVTDMPFAQQLRGRGGRLLAGAGGGGPQAYRGTTVAGFPNLYLLLGPNTGLGHTSVVLMIEAQIEYVRGALRAMERRRIDALEPRPEAQAAFNEDVQRRLRNTVWNSGGCVSWYLDRQGRNTTIWPGSTFGFGRQVRHFDLDAYSPTRRVGNA